MAKIHKPQDQNGIDLINQTVFDNEHVLRVAEEARIEGKLDTEIERSTNKDNDLDEKINNEINRATTNESVISVILNDEIERSTNKDNELDVKINTEINRATTSENNITTALNVEITRSTEEDTRLNSAIEAEASRATDVENDIIETLSSFAGENIVTETETLNSSERELIVGQIEQKFESSNTFPVSVRGFGEIIQKTGQLKSIKIYCPSSSNTTQSVWLKVFEKTNNGNIFVGISDNSDTHGQNETLLYTFEQSQFILYANKEYYFVFCTEAQKDLTVYYDGSHSVDCCLKCSNNNGTGGLLGSNGYSVTATKPIYNIFLYKPVISSVELNTHICDKGIHISEEERTSWNEVKMAWDETKTNFTNNLPEITADKLNSWGFMIKSPKSGSLKTITSFCRESGAVTGGETYLKVWNEANECIGCSVNKFAHSLNAVHEYIFENITLEKDSYYKFSYITDEEQKTTSDTNSNVQVCLKSTPLFPKGEVDQIFNGYSLNQSLDRQVLNNTSSVQIIIDINFFDEIEKLEKKISSNEENISAIGIDIDSINETINSITEPKLEILTYATGDPHDGLLSVDEITLDVYTTDESGVTNPVDTLPDIYIFYQCTDGFIYTSNAVAYSPFINVVLSEENNQYTETGENNISEGRPQHTATLKFSGLSGIKEDITRVIIFDAIVAGNSSNGYNKCKHISRILPVHFRVAPSTPEES